MTLTYLLMSALLIAGALFACIQSPYRKSLPQEVLIDRVSEAQKRRQ
ncbi:hypothetical protein ACQUQU_12715 [Thalassolituus sp. LLYu03]